MKDRRLRTLADISTQLESYWNTRYVGQRPTVKQRTVLADRSIPCPPTPLDASKLIGEIARAEGWGEI